MERNEIFLYVDKSTDPDKIKGMVPFRVSDRHIFFGPGETRFRADLWKRFLARTDDFVPNVNLYVIAVNDVRSENDVRKILWLGRIERFMTFAVAYSLLKDPEFEPLINVEDAKGNNMSPLHLDPVDVAGRLSGYRHRSDYHNKTSRDGIPEWVKDVADPRMKRDFGVAGKEMLLADVSMRRKILTRDCCFVLENIFFAQGEGMELADKFVSLMSEWQPGQNVDRTGIFGYSKDRNGKTKMNKMKGSHMHIRWRVADAMIDYLLDNTPGYERPLE